MAGKPLVASTDYGVRVLISKLSHNLLADLAISLIRARLGKPELDGAELCAAIFEHASLVAKVRGDRVPPADIAERDLLAKLQKGEGNAEVMRAWLKRERGIDA